MTLNPRQQKFVLAYLAGASAADAYRSAGYHCRTAHAAESKASALLRTPAVGEAIAAVAEKAGLTAEWVTRRLMVEATRTGKGASHAARVRALELLGRRFGLFAEQLEVSGPAGGPVPVDLRRLSDDQLAALDQLLAAADAGGEGVGSEVASGSGSRPGPGSGGEPGGS